MLALVHTWRGRAHAALERPLEAISAFDEALAVDPRMVPALQHRADAHAGLDHWEASLGDLTRAAEIEPSNEEVSAARTLGALSSLALRQQALDLARDKRDGTGQGRTLADLVEEAERLAEEFDRARDPAAAGDVGGGSPDGPAPGPVA